MAALDTHLCTNVPSFKFIHAHFQLQGTATAILSSANQPKEIFTFLTPRISVQKRAHGKLQYPGVHRVSTEKRSALQHDLQHTILKKELH